MISITFKAPDHVYKALLDTIHELQKNASDSRAKHVSSIVYDRQAGRVTLTFNRGNTFHKKTEAKQRQIALAFVPTKCLRNGVIIV
jgi:hypothetical protein